MKKLMIAAAAAAMIGGAYADACDDVYDLVDADGCLVYDLTIKVKTLGPKKMKCKGNCSNNYCEEPVYYLEKTTRTLKGYVWQCASDCWDENTGMNIALWEPKSKNVFIDLPYAQNDKGAYVQYPNTINVDFIGRYGKKADKVAVAWNADLGGTAPVTCAAVGGSVFKDKDGCTVTLKSISGNCAGMIQLFDVDTGSPCRQSNVKPQIASLCDCFEDWCAEVREGGNTADADEAPAAGTWSLKYNKKLSKGSKSMLELVPSFARTDENAQ